MAAVRRKSGDAPGRNEGFRRVHDAITAALGLAPSPEEVAALRAYVDGALAAVAAQSPATVRALASDEPGFDLGADEIVAQQGSTDEFFAFLDSRPPAGAHNADPR